MFRKLVLIAAAFAVSLSAPADAGSMFSPKLPEGASLTDPNAIWRLYVGKSARWSGTSFAYWAPDQLFRAVDTAEGNVGVGKWYVTSASRMCYEATWHWRQDFGVTSKAEKNCFQYATDASGQTWSRTADHGQYGLWLPFDGSGLEKGDIASQPFRAVAKMLGL